MTRLVLRPAAARDVEAGYDWYEDRRLGLGEEFLEEVSRALRVVLDNPLRYPVIWRDTRRALLPRFPYGLFYRLHEDRILIIACMHASRDPVRWSTRE